MEREAIPARRMGLRKKLWTSGRESVTQILFRGF
jgi:hypothetical protein